jgi:urea transport system ATP-binding protein
VTSRFGKVLVAVRDAEARTRFLGYRPESYKLVVWVLSAVMAGIGGALYVPQVGIINPSEFSPANSIEAVIWVAIGGRGTLSGAILGAVLVNLGKTYFTSALPSLWLYALGAIFIFVTLLLPRGIVGLFAWRGRATCRSHRRAGPAREAPDERDTTERGDTLALPGWRHRHFRWLPRVERSVPGAGSRRDARGDRSERRRQDDDDGRDHRQDAPDRGKVVFGRNTDLTRLDEPAIASLGIGRKFQKPTVFEPHTVWDNLLLSLAEDRRPRFTLWARETAAERGRIEEILVTTRLVEQRHRPAADLSHGQKQWLEIGMLLAQEPQLLLVDEPVAGMTDAETEQTAELLREINRTRSVVVVEHDMAFVRALDVKVTVLHEGSVLSEGSIDHVSEDPRVVEVYLGR